MTPSSKPSSGSKPSNESKSSKGSTPSKEAKRVAAVLLDVLAGSRSTLQAAEALGVSLPRYYQLEARGLEGLLEACEPRPRGRQPDAGLEMEVLRKENEQLRREVQRQQSLARLTQRTLGVTAPVPAKPDNRKRKRKATVRAMRRAEKLRDEAAEDASPGSPGTE
jgi:hypothetical protein